MRVTVPLGILVLALAFSDSTWSEGAADGELFAAAAAGQVERVDALLAQGADVNAKNSAERTPLMGAASAGNVRIIRRLLAFGADPNAADGRGSTPLMEAGSNGFEQAVRALVAGAADLNAKDKAGKTALDRVKKAGYTGIAAFLEQSGAKSGEMPKPASEPGDQKAEDKGGEEKPAEPAEAEGEKKP